MQWKPIDITDRELIESYTKNNRIEISDITFTNLFIWHFSRAICYAIVDETLLIKTRYPNENPFIFYPIGGGDKKSALLRAKKYFTKNNFPFVIKSLSNADLEELNGFEIGTFEIYKNRDRFDYVYSVQELIELKGRKYHKKKNHLNRFKELYEYKYERITKENLDELLEMWKFWFGQNGDKVSEGLKNEYIGVVEVIRYFDSLSLKGGLLRIDGKIVAFSFGEELNSDTVVIHTEKADIEIHGAYQMINQQFLENEWSDYTYVNREEDLGIEGLRKAKNSYNPIYLVEKNEATLVRPLNISCQHKF